MQVILMERIGSLGQMGDIVNVKAGYARNFLLPQGKAMRATEANKAEFEKQRVQLEARNLEAKSEAAAVGERLEGQQFVAIRQAGDTGQLYGSVSTRDVAEVVSAGGYSIDRRQIELAEPIKALGVHPVKITLHPEVIVEITMNVARSEDEAERQARGEDVTVIQDDELDIETFDPDADGAGDDVFEAAEGEAGEQTDDADRA